MKYLAIVLSVVLVSCIGISEEKTMDELDAEFTTQMESVKDTTAVSADVVPETIEDHFTSATTFTPEHGWGYQILNNGEMYINQPHIPAVPGNKGFDSEEKATTTANFIIYKLDNGLFPPTISAEELDSLGVM